VTQPLDYAPPALRRRFSPANWPTLCALSMIALTSGSLSKTGGHLIPGGPFVSIHANVIPAVTCLAIIGLAWPALRRAPALIRFGAACVVLGSALVVILVIQDVMMFWLRPYARGVLLAW